MHGMTRIVWQPGLAPEPTWRELWQVPLFVAGVLALAVAGGLFWLLPTASLRLAARELAAAQAALDAGAVEDVAPHLEAAGRIYEQLGRPSGELELLRGSVLFQQAEAAQGPTQAELYGQALVQLRSAQQLGVGKDVAPRLRYRLAVAQYHTGGDADTAIKEIDAALDESPRDRLAGYALLSRLYLARSKPNLTAALRANERLLAQVGLANPNPARLQRGELLLQLKQHEEARLVLSRIPSTAPEHATARHLRAWSQYQGGEWQAAVELWEPALRDDVAHVPQLPQALYGLGECYQALGRTADAQSIWQRAQREAPGTEEATAAAFKLALLHTAADQYDDALAQFQQGLRGLTPDWRGAYTDAAELRQQIETTWTAWLNAGRHEPARQLARLYQPIALPGEAARRHGLASQRAGITLLRQAERTSSSQREQLAGEGRKLLREAGESFETAVRELGVEGDSGELLWQSAENYLQAQEPARAAAVLEVLLRGTLTPARQQEAQVALGEAYQALRRSEAAAKLLQQASARPGPLQLRARYLLALAQIDLGKYDAAEAVLKEIMQMPVIERGTEELRLARFALVHVLFRREGYADAADYLEKALATDAEQPQSVATRYWLAEAYRRAARQEKKSISSADTTAAREFYLKLKRQQLERALAQFQHVVSALDAGAAQQTLTAEDATRLRESRLGVGECLFNLGRYEEAVTIYRTQFDQDGVSVGALNAGMHLTQCYLTLKKLDEAKSTITRARGVLSQLSEKEFETAQTNRHAWQDWFDNAAASTQPRTTQ
jgi:tetratricopeptide (TPR) repeat protein